MSTLALSVLRRAWQRITCWLGLHFGTVETWTEGGHWWIGHVCATCFKVSHPTHMQSCRCALRVGEVER